MAEDDNEKSLLLQAAAAERLPEGRQGLRMKGWVVESCNAPILTSLALQQWEEKLGTSHLPEMIFGESILSLLHEKSGIKLHFNAFDALKGWKLEALPPVEVPAAAKWKFRSKPLQEVVLDYDYTFTTPYQGSEMVQPTSERGSEGETCHLKWEDCDQRIDLDDPALREPILFYDEVILYEDELADNGVSLLSAKVRVMPNCWFLLLRFWLRVDGVLVRLRDTRMYCSFGSDWNAKPSILRETTWREATIQSFSKGGFPSDSGAYSDPNQISQKIPITRHKIQKLVV